MLDLSLASKRGFKVNLKALNIKHQTLVINFIVCVFQVDKFFSKSETESAAGAGYKVLQVLKGKSDLYYHSTFIKKWDLCAGDAMLRAAGGQLMTRKKQLLTYEYFTEPLNKDGVLASLANSQWFYEKAKL